MNTKYFPRYLHSPLVLTMRALSSVGLLLVLSALTLLCAAMETTSLLMAKHQAAVALGVAEVSTHRLYSSAGPRDTC